MKSEVSYSRLLLCAGLGLILYLIPTLQGLRDNAWHLFSIYALVIVVGTGLAGASAAASLTELPQGRQKAATRVVDMVAKMEESGFGHCSNTGACELECQQNTMNYEYNKVKMLKKIIHCQIVLNL